MEQRLERIQKMMEAIILEQMELTKKLLDKMAKTSRNMGCKHLTIMSNMWKIYLRLWLKLNLCNKVQFDDFNA